MLSKISPGCEKLLAVELLFNFSYTLGSTEGLLSQNPARTLASGREEALLVVRTAVGRDPHREPQKLSLASCLSETVYGSDRLSHPR